MLRFALILCVLISATQARADFSVESVRAALDGGNFVELERLLREEHAQAVTEQNFDDLRRVHSLIFGVANLDRHAKMQEWFATTNESPYAATALGWAHYKRAFLVRGELNWAMTPESSQSGYLLELDAAKKFANHAFARDKSYAPSLDLVIVLNRGGTGRAVPPLLKRLLRLAPDRTSLGNAFAALDPNWGALPSERRALCSQFSDSIPNVDLRSCLMMAEYRPEGEGFVRNMVLAELDRRDDPYYDHMRLDAYLNEWSDRPEARAEVMRIHRDMAQPGMSFFWYNRRLDRIESLFPNPLYKIEATRAYYDIARIRVEDSPENYHVLLPMIRYILNERPYDAPARNSAAAWSYWQDALIFGSGNYTIWEMGGTLAFQEFGSLAVAERWPFFVNQIAYLANEPSTVRGVLGQLVMMHRTATDDMWRPYVPEGAPPLDYAAAEEALICPMIRVARLYQETCSAASHQQGCNIGGWGVDHPEEVFQIAARHGGCLWEKTAPLEELRFDPIPNEEVLEVIGR